MHKVLFEVVKEDLCSCCYDLVFGRKNTRREKQGRQDLFGGMVQER